MAVRTTAGSDTIDTDFVGFFFCCCCSFKKKKKRGGRSRIWKVVFQQSNHYHCDHVSHKWERWTGIPMCVLPPIQTERAVTSPTVRKMAQPPFKLAEKGSLELREMASSTHSILMACNRVGYTYVTTHFLIWFLFQTPFQDPIHLKNVITW